VVRAHADEYRRAHRPSAAQATVLKHLAECRTPALGGHVQACDSCGHQRIAYNSCRDRHCPKCQNTARAAWITERLERLLLEAAGLPPAEYSDLAMGIGLDRILMLRKGIDDIRALRSTDPRIASQMLDLEPYRPVSSQPAIERDLSIAVSAAASPEELGDRVRQAMGPRSSSLEAVVVLAKTAYAKLPEAARARLGLSPEQKNVLLRLVIRDLERTLTSADANMLRDEVYAVLHEGRVHSWAGRP
jgi:hypothetical protein